MPPDDTIDLLDESRIGHALHHVANQFLVLLDTYRFRNIPSLAGLAHCLCFSDSCFLACHIAGCDCQNHALVGFAHEQIGCICQGSEAVLVFVGHFITSSVLLLISVLHSP